MLLAPLQKKPKSIQSPSFPTQNTSTLQTQNCQHHTDIHHRILPTNNRITHLHIVFIKSIPKWEEYYKFESNEISLKNSKSMRITSLQIHELWKDLRKSISIYNWTSPNTLEVFFECCSRIHNSTIESIALAITRSFPNIQSLAFDFNYCLDIRNEGIEIFMKHITRSIGKSLISFKISLVNCLNITDQGFKGLGIEIGRNLVNLKYLYIDISRKFLFIQDETMLTLFTKLKSLTHLEKLTLKFKKSRLLKERTLLALADIIRRYLTKLQFLEIEFRGSENITIQVKNELREKLSHIKHLQIQ